MVADINLVTPAIRSNAAPTMIFDDGDQRVELRFLGHAHTAGDAVAFVPRHGILFTGDACVNGAFNYTGDSDTESWIGECGFGPAD